MDMKRFLFFIAPQLGRLFKEPLFFLVSRYVTGCCLMAAFIGIATLCVYKVGKSHLREENSVSRLERLIVEQAAMALAELRDACSNPITLATFVKTAADLGIDPEDVALAEKTRLQLEVTAFTQLAQVDNPGMTDTTIAKLRAIQDDCDRLLASMCVANDDGDRTQLSWVPTPFERKSA
ncbi:MAG: hypothetical protein AAF066_02175 [Pseudomonadota bacterium]